MRGMECMMLAFLHKEKTTVSRWRPGRSITPKRRRSRAYA
jgi:hypothetical protein